VSLQLKSPETSAAYRIAVVKFDGRLAQKQYFLALRETNLWASSSYGRFVGGLLPSV
jgi:hypothetical protein